MRIRRVLIAVFVTSVMAACQTVRTTEPGAIGVERKQVMLVSQERVEKGAQKAYSMELAQARSTNVLNTELAAYDRVQRIAQRLIPQTSVFRTDAPQWQWEVNVQTSEKVNAYCMPGGKIMVYTGLIELLEITDEELAAVIGHEISHALREHSRERLSRAYAEQVVLAGAAIAVGGDPNMVDLARQISALTFTLPHSRAQETEADRIGLELMARAGYDPNAAISLWEKMGRLSHSGPEFFSTHPSSDSRIRELKESVPRVLPFYRPGAE